jgi:hypothetical protein
MVAVATWPNDITTVDGKKDVLVLEGYQFTIASPRYFAGRKIKLWVDAAIQPQINVGDAIELDLSNIELTNQNGVWTGYPTRGFPFTILPNQSTDPVP